MLQELVAYGEKYLSVSEPGFKSREVRWRVEIAEDGRLLGVLPLGDGKQGKALTRCPDMHGMNAGGKSHFLVETVQTAVLLFKADEDDSKIHTSEVRHRFFVGLLKNASTAIPRLVSLVNLLEDTERLERVRDALSSRKAKPTDWLVWVVEGFDPREDMATQDWWRTWRKTDLGGNDNACELNSPKLTGQKSEMLCLLTGTRAPPLATHPKITGLSGVGGLAMGDVMVGFDKAAFGSYELEQSANAAMGEAGVQKYVDSLNHLIRNNSRKLANTMVVHWYKDSVVPEDDPLGFLMGLETEESTEAAAGIAASRLLDAIRTGTRSELENNRYYALTISGAAGRVMVRDWMEGRFEDLASHITAWFADLSIVARDGMGIARDPKFMAVCGALLRELKDLPAPTAAILWKVALLGNPIPQPIMAQALARFRADLVNNDQPAFNHARMGLIKAYYVRLKLGGDKTMTATYNNNHPIPAYHCGGLLALLANLQRAALGDVGAGVVQRFYAATSQTPGLVLGRLTGNARNHLAKLEPGLAWWYEERIAEIMSNFGDSAPRILDLEGQGLFAIGYYQKLAELRSGNKSALTNAQGVSL